MATAAPRLPHDHGHLALMQESYNHLREFTPAVLESIEFADGQAAAGLLEAVRVTDRTRDQPRPDPHGRGHRDQLRHPGLDR